MSSIGHQGLVFLDGIRENSTDESFILSAAHQLDYRLLNLDQSLDDQLFQEVGVLGSLRDESKLSGTISLELLRKVSPEGVERRLRNLHLKVHV